MPKCLKCGAGPEWLQGKIPNELPEELKRKTDCAEPKHEDVVYCLQCSDRDISALEKKLADALLQIEGMTKEREKLYLWKNEINPAPLKMMDFPREHWDAFTAGYFWGQRSISNTLLEDANRLNGELRTALEIAFPSMAHTYSGHEDPSVWVEGCGKCRAARLLSNPLKRNDEVKVYPVETCGRCGRVNKLVGIACPCIYA